MGLEDVVKELMEDKLKIPPEIWKTLEKKMKEEGLKEEYKNMDKTDSLKAYNLLKVLDALGKYLRKESNPWSSSRHETLFKVVNAISEIDEIEEVIKALGESGYEPTIKDMFTFAFLPEESLKIFEILAKDRLYKKYGLVSKSIKSLGYKGVSSYAKSKHSVDMQQLDYLINISRLEGDVSGAVYVLVSHGYKIDKVTGLSKLDFNSIKKITEEDKKEKAEGKGGIPVYLYNTGHVVLFQDYFNSLETKNKKSVLRSILNYEPKEDTNNQIKEWLEKDYENLLREVGFE